MRLISPKALCSAKTAIAVFLAAATLCGCRSSRQAAATASAAADSMARSAEYRSSAVLDSLCYVGAFEFDTLSYEVATPTETVRIRAVKGKLTSQNKVHHLAIDAYNRTDSIAAKMVNTETTAEHTASTRVYDPPKGTVVFIVAILVLGLLVYFFVRRF